MLRLAVYIIVAVLIASWVVSNPAHSGDIVHGWITGIVTFFHHAI